METVVIAEDHQLITEGYRFLIDKIDQLEIAETAMNGQKAIEAVKKHKPDYLILDLHMPEVNGMDVLKYVSENYPDIKVIVISMFGNASIHKEVVRLGAKGYILKQADQDEFLMAIKMIMKGKTYYSGDIFKDLPALKTVSHSTPVIPLVWLTPREEEVLVLLARGLTNKQIGKKLFVSPATINSHRANIMKKLDVHSVTGIVKYALTHGYEL